MLQYLLSLLFLIAIIGIGIPYDFSFAFHTPGSGYTIINGQMYANNGTDNRLDPLFVQPMNGSATFANPTVPQPMNGSATFANTTVSQPMNGSATFANPTVPQPMNGSATFANPTVPQPMNGTQNLISTTSDIIYHINLARQALELGNPHTILKELDFVEQQLYFIAKNATSDFSTMSNYSSTELEGSDATQEEAPDDIGEDMPVPVDEQLPRSSSTRDDTPQRTRSYQ